jgi:hypothetical protein
MVILSFFSGLLLLILLTSVDIFHGFCLTSCFLHNFFSFFFYFIHPCSDRVSTC